MRRIILCLSVAAVLAACNTEQRLEERAAELCAYIPDPESLEKSRDYMTPDFYAVLDTMFYRLPAHEAMDHEYNYWFVTDDGTPLAGNPCEVLDVVLTDATHAVATVCDHRTLSMERVNGEWLMADFDGHKADGIRYIAINRKEQAVRQAISDYLLREIGVYYLHPEGASFIPTLMMVHETDSCVWGDFQVFWYNLSGDTLKTVSGGNHSGCMTIRWNGTQPEVIAFDQTEDGAGNDASARRIFGAHYDIYQNMHSNESVREAVRREQLGEYVQQHGLPVHYYRDYGWEAVKL